MAHLPLAVATAAVLAVMATVPAASTPAASAAVQAMPPVLRVGYQAPVTGACAAPGQTTPPALAGLARHLATRLKLSVQLCPLSDAAAAASAIAHGSVDLAKLTPAAWPGVKGTGRPILTLRTDGTLPRTPIFAIARKSLGPLDAATIAQRRVVLTHRDSLAYDAARAAVATHGGGALTRSPTPVAASFAAALAALGAGSADVVLTPGDQWKTGCMTDRSLCAPYQIAWRDWPQAQTAWVLRAGLPDELRYRLIGIFLAMNLENPLAFAGAADGVKGAFEPTEATALDGGARH